MDVTRGLLAFRIFVAERINSADGEFKLCGEIVSRLPIYRCAFLDAKWSDIRAAGFVLDVTRGWLSTRVLCS